MNAFNIAEIKATIATAVVGKDGKAVAVFEPKALEQFRAVNIAMQETFGRTEDQLTDLEKEVVLESLKSVEDFSPAQLAVDGVVKARPDVDIEASIAEIREGKDSQGVVIAFVSNLMFEIIEANCAQEVVVNDFNTAELQAKIADLAVAKEGVPFVTFTNESLVQLANINEALQERFGRTESELTDVQKAGIVEFVKELTVRDITGNAVNGVVPAIEGGKYEKILEQITTYVESKSVEIAYTTKMVFAVISGNERFNPAH